MEKRRTVYRIHGILHSVQWSGHWAGSFRAGLEPDLRRRIRQEKVVLIINILHAWMIAQRDLVPEGSAISRALDYSLKRWAALSRYLVDGAVPTEYYKMTWPDA
jgi:hypothetical protein